MDMDGRLEESMHGNRLDTLNEAGGEQAPRERSQAGSVK